VQQLLHSLVSKFQNFIFCWSVPLLPVGEIVDQTSKDPSALQTLLLPGIGHHFVSCNLRQLATSDRQNQAGNLLHYTMEAKVFGNYGPKLIRDDGNFSTPRLAIAAEGTDRRV